MQLDKLTIKGKKGSTICYTLPNFRYDPDDNKLKWDAFRFYTPEGNQTDEEGHIFFDVPAEEVIIQRDDTFNKELMIVITRQNGVEAIEILEGAKSTGINIGLEGDIVAFAFIPTDTAQEIIVQYKEVTNG